MSAILQIPEGYTMEDIVKAVFTVLQPLGPDVELAEEPDEYVPKDTVKRYRSLDDYPDIMKVNDVQHYLRIGNNAAYELLNHPQCPTFRVGNSIRIRSEKLLQFIEAWENGLEGVRPI